jgi:glycine/D-amino acid oxidase-like deaminating enzyme
MELEENALNIYSALVEKEKIDCDLHITRSVDIFYDKEDAKRGKEDFAGRRKDFPEVFKKADVRDMGSYKEAEKVTGVKDAVWSASYPAGHLWPYLLATACKSVLKTALMPVIRICIQRHGLNLQTYTPATNLQRSGDKWIVKTPRGEIKTPLVIATTNAYTASILPDFKTKIFPVRGTASSITPAPSHSIGAFPGPIKYTYGFRHGTGDTDYMIARQGRITPGKGDQSIILGGAKSTFLKDHELWYNNINDNELFPGARKYFEDFMPERFAGWTGDAKNVDYVWSGVLGYSADFKPFVGPHPEKEGVFVCAGFTGHGECTGFKRQDQADFQECRRSRLPPLPFLHLQWPSSRTAQRFLLPLKRLLTMPCRLHSASQERGMILQSMSSKSTWVKEEELKERSKLRMKRR